MADQWTRKQHRCRLTLSTAMVCFTSGFRFYVCNQIVLSNATVSYSLWYVIGLFDIVAICDNFNGGPKSWRLLLFDSSWVYCLVKCLLRIAIDAFWHESCESEVPMKMGVQDKNGRKWGWHCVPFKIHPKIEEHQLQQYCQELCDNIAALCTTNNRFDAQYVVNSNACTNDIGQFPCLLTICPFNQDVASTDNYHHLRPLASSFHICMQFFCIFTPL